MMLAASLSSHPSPPLSPLAPPRHVPPSLSRVHHTTLTHIARQYLHHHPSTTDNARDRRGPRTHPTPSTLTPFSSLSQTPAANMQAFAGQRVAARTGLASAAPRRVLVIEAAHKKGQLRSIAEARSRMERDTERARPSPSPPTLAAGARRDRPAILRARCVAAPLRGRSTPCRHREARRGPLLRARHGGLPPPFFSPLSLCGGESRRRRRRRERGA